MQPTEYRGNIALRCDLGRSTVNSTNSGYRLRILHYDYTYAYANTYTNTNTNTNAYTNT